MSYIYPVCIYWIKYLVELVDAADTVVCEDESTGLKNKLASLRILGDVGSQADGRRPLSGSVLRSRHQVKDVLEELRLGGAGVSAQEDVDLGTELAAAGRQQLLLRAAEQLHEDT